MQRRTSKKKVLVFGTFDVLHPGHISFLTQAKQYGYVTVALTTDKQCSQYKGFAPIHSFAKRRQRLRALSLVSYVISSDKHMHSWEILDRVRPDVILLGYDQSALRHEIKKKAENIGWPVTVQLAVGYRESLYQSRKMKIIASQIVKPEVQ